MIADPLPTAQDAECLRRLTAIARERVNNPSVVAFARANRTPAGIAAALRARPQLDDDGSGNTGPTVFCDYPVRIRVNPDNPDCVERAVEYIAAAELVAPDALRRLITVTVSPAGREPYRHVAAVEQQIGSKEVIAVDLFPVRRNADGRSTRQEIGDVVAEYIHPAGEGFLKFWLGDKAGGAIGSFLAEGENAAFDRSPRAPQANEKRSNASHGERNRSKPQGKAGGGGGGAKARPARRRRR